MNVLVVRDEYGTVDVFKPRQAGSVLERRIYSASYTDYGEKAITKEEALRILRREKSLDLYEEGDATTRYQFDIVEVQSVGY